MPCTFIIEIAHYHVPSSIVERDVMQVCIMNAYKRINIFSLDSMLYLNNFECSRFYVIWNKNIPSPLYLSSLIIYLHGVDLPSNLKDGGKQFTDFFMKLICCFSITLTNKDKYYSTR